MKFGETLYQRSVPKWAAYNVKYNELKHLIKQRTSAGAALPISIPSASTSRWHDLDTELYPIIKREYDHVSLFLRSKQGEIERRLVYLEKQVNAATRAVANADIDKPAPQARKFQRLVKDAEAIGDEIECLSRFTAVQKAAFRKILKKYRKWTGSSELQARLENEVFSSGALQVECADYLKRLATLTTSISTKLQTPMLTGSEAQRAKRRAGRTLSQSNAKTINDLCLKGPLHLDAALDQVLYGENGGSAYFWIHPDYLEQVETLLLRHMKQTPPPHASSRNSPTQSSTDLTKISCSAADTTYQAVFDNAQRFVRDDSNMRASRAALVARWNNGSEAVVTYSSLMHKSEEASTLCFKRKYLSGTLSRSQSTDDFAPIRSPELDKLSGYLSENRDVKPLAIIRSDRARFSGLNNTKDVGSWATLDTSLAFAYAKDAAFGQLDGLGENETFPHAVLHIRWEFTRLPEIVRILEASNLAERVHAFSIEQAAVFTLNMDLPQPEWRELLANDIRRVPALLQKKTPGSSRRKNSLAVGLPSSSGPSSTDSVFSAGPGLSSATEAEAPEGPTMGTAGAQTMHAVLSNKSARKSKKKSARFAAPAPQEVPQRYWNEFDDGDSDTNPEERFAIYIDPNEPSFPGVNTVAKVFSGIHDGISKSTQRFTSWIPTRRSGNDGERRPLLFGRSGRNGSSDANYDSSGSETDDLSSKIPTRTKRGPMSRPPYAPSRRLSKRQKARERTLQQSYVALTVLAYVLLVMSGALLATGRKKKRLEVDAGVVTGAVSAFACIGIAIVLICMRRESLGPIHWGFFAVQVAVVGTVGIALLVLMLGNATST